MAAVGDVPDLAGLVVAIGAGHDAFPGVEVGGASPDTVPADAVMGLAVMGGPILTVRFISTVFISNRYPLSKSGHADIIQSIGERKPAESAA